MALSRVNFTLVTPYTDVRIKDFTPVLGSGNMPATLAPDDADVLRDGEFFKLTSAYKATRASTTDGIAGVKAPSWVLYNEKDRSDIVGAAKVSLIFQGSYEADTKLFLAADAGDGFALKPVTLGAPLCIAKGAAVSGGYAKFAALAQLATTKTDFVVGFVTRLPADNGGLLRFYATAGGYGNLTSNL